MSVMRNDEQTKRFEQLNGAVQRVFEAYRNLNASFTDLSASVLKIPMDTKDIATLITIMSKETRDTLVIYLKRVQKMSAVIRNYGGQENSSVWSRCTYQADIALRAMADLNNQQGAEDMIRKLENIAITLQKEEQSGNYNTEPIDGAVQYVLKLGGNAAKGLTLALFDNIKAALDDRNLYVNLAELKTKLKSVAKDVSVVKEAYGDNASSLNEVKSSFRQLSREQNGEVINLLKPYAEALQTICDKELSNVYK